MNHPIGFYPQYQSHKVVGALKIKQIIASVKGLGATIVPEDENYGAFEVSDEYMTKHKPKEGGYYVVYQDGYESWSPADVFEKGYTKIN